MSGDCRKGCDFTGIMVAVQRHPRSECYAVYSAVWLCCLNTAFLLDCSLARLIDPPRFGCNSESTPMWLAAQCNIRYNKGLTTFPYTLHWAEQQAPKIQVYLEPQSVTLFRSRVYADVIS